MKIYLVGGAVRDEILKRHSHDNDYVVVGSSPREMATQGFRQVGSDFPVFLHPKTKEEYALARKEAKISNGHKGFSFDFNPQVSLEEDLKRRDLTINAIAKSEDGAIIDPFNGQADINSKILKHVSSHFGEDPLRVIRVARFAAQLPTFTIHQETIKLMTEMASKNELETLSGERIYQELTKAMLCDNPWIFFQTLFDCGAIQKIFPEVASLKGIPQSKDYHPEGDALTHTRLVLENACQLSPDLDVRIAALTHDLGKANTPKEILPKHTGHEKRGVDIIKKLAERIKIPKKIKQLAILVSQYHFQAHQILELPPQATLEILLATKALKEKTTFDKFLICCLADDLGKLSHSYPQKKYLEQCQQELSNQDLSSILEKYQGKEIGDKINETHLQYINSIKRGFSK